MSKCPSQYLVENLITIVPGLKLRKNDDIFLMILKTWIFSRTFKKDLKKTFYKQYMLG